MVDWALIVTSAATGSLITVLAQTMNQAWDRRSRRHDLVLSMAFQIAQERIAACRERYSMDPLLETEKCYRALLSVVAGQGVPADEVNAAFGLLRLRMRRGVREKVLDHRPPTPEERALIKQAVDKHLSNEGAVEGNVETHSSKSSG